MQIRAHNPEDDEALVKLNSDHHAALPPTTVEDFRAERETAPAGCNQQTLVAELDGEMRGYARVMEAFWTGEAGAFVLGLVVAAPYQGQGLGGELYERAAHALAGWRATKVYANVYQDDTVSRAFARHRGFTETEYISRHSRLEVNSATLDGYQNLEVSLRSQGIRVESVAALGPEDEEMLRAVHETQMVAGRDEPSAQPYEMEFEPWLRMVRSEPGLTPETMLVALHGNRPIGVTLLREQPGGNASLFGMCVLRAYRGRGVARLLKLRQIEWARKHGVQALYTANDINNPRMYDINVRLGFLPLPATINVTKGL